MHHFSGHPLITVLEIKTNASILSDLLWCGLVFVVTWMIFFAAYLAAARLRWVSNVNWRLIVISPQRHFHGLSIIFEPDYVNLFGYLCAAELVLRAWMRLPGGRAISRGEAMILTALVLAAASNTYTAAVTRHTPTNSPGATGASSAHTTAAMRKDTTRRSEDSLTTAPVPAVSTPKRSRWG